jgi:hypothetical protein
VMKLGIETAVRSFGAATCSSKALPRRVRGNAYGSLG